MEANDLFNNGLIEKRKITENKINELFFLPVENTVKRSESFFEVFEDFISANKPDKAVKTIKGYISVKSYLLRFQDSMKFFITWNNLNM